jgi:hypothetical protein
MLLAPASCVTSTCTSHSSFMMTYACSALALSPRNGVSLSRKCYGEGNLSHSKAVNDMVLINLALLPRERC